MKRVKECIVCGGSRCVEFDDKYYCFRFGVTRKKSKEGGQKKVTGSFEGGLGGTFSKVPTKLKTKNKNQERFDFGDESISAIGL